MLYLLDLSYNRLVGTKCNVKRCISFQQNGLTIRPGYQNKHGYWILILKSSKSSNNFYLTSNVGLLRDKFPVSRICAIHFVPGVFGCLEVFSDG